MAFEEENRYNQLEELNGSGYQIVEGEPDITGWEVIDAEGRKIGDIDDVLFDPQTRDVRYLIIDLDDNELEIDADKKVLVPIGIAELSAGYDEEDMDDDSLIDNDTPTVAAEDEDLADEDEVYDDEVVYLPTVTAAQLLALPAYEKGALSPETETAIRNVFETPAADTVVVYDKDSFYTHEHFNNRLYDRTNTGYNDTSAEASRLTDGFKHDSFDADEERENRENGKDIF